MEHEDRPLIGVETAKPALELVAVGEVRGRVGDWRLQDRNVDLDAPSSTAALGLAIARANQ